MITRTGLVIAAVAVLFGAASAGEPETPPAFAFPYLDPSVKMRPDDGRKMSLPGSKAAFTLTEMFDVFTAYDWFPDEHPPMPEVVAHGRKPEVRACGMCHMPNGQGRPENAALAGLPADYIVRQTEEIAAGKRKSAVPQAGPQLRMLASASHADPAEIRAAAAYFSKLAYRPWIRVVESPTAPRAEVKFGTMWAAVDGAPEPIGRRIVEVPEDYERTELRDPHSGFVAYVPPGSIAAGERLVSTGSDTTGRDKTLACAACHGPDLKGGLTEAPPIAGRPASYIVRQLWDIRAGTRAGVGAELMKPVTEKLELDDMIAIAAYVASRTP